MSAKNDSYGYHDTVGNDRACAWRNGPGCIKLQFRDSLLSRKFQRSGIRSVCVDIGVDGGGYLRIFTVEGKTLGWFKRWLARNETPD